MSFAVGSASRGRISRIAVYSVRVRCFRMQYALLRTATYINRAFGIPGPSVAARTSRSPIARWWFAQHGAF